MQRNLLQLDGRVIEALAAKQHSFPIADIQIDQIDPNPIRSFAAPVSDVSVAEILLKNSA